MSTEVEKASEREEKVAELRKPTKVQIQQQRIFQERIQRKVAKGMALHDAVAAVKKEDWDRLPIEKKLERYEETLRGGLKGFRNDLMKMEQNDVILADTMEVNFRAFQKILRKLGVSDEDQKVAVKEATQEINEERAAHREAEAARRKVAKEEGEKESLESSIDKPGEPPAPPEEATSFG